MMRLMAATAIKYYDKFHKKLLELTLDNFHMTRLHMFWKYNFFADVPQSNLGRECIHLVTPILLLDQPMEV